MKHRCPSTLRPLRLALALAAALASLQPATATIFPSAGPYWNAIEIAPANGFGNQLFPSALNDAGWVVGSFNDAGGDRGFIWSGVSGRAPQRLPLSDAWGITADGTVLGAALGSSLRRDGYTSLTGREYAVQVAPNGAITVLTPTNLTTNNAGQTFGMAFAANANGTVVGVSTDAAGQYGAAIWNNGNGPSFIDISTGSQGRGLGGRTGLAINDAGTVVGGTNQLQTWSAARGRTDLGGLATAIDTSGVGINNAGLIVGNSSFSDGLSNGFIYRPDTARFTVLPGLGEGTGSSLAWGLNERGDVVGTSGGVLRAWTNRATWWKPGGEVVDLNSLNFANLSGVRLQTAIDINNRGQILVSGMRVDSAGDVIQSGPDGGLRHWVLTLCERCGQIAPDPNPTGTTLDVGPDWYDAHNAVDFQNHGHLQVSTTLVNLPGAAFTNRGQVVIHLDGRWSNQDLLVNDASGQLSIGGTFENSAGLGVINRGAVSVVTGGTLVLRGPAWFNGEGSSFVQSGGVVANAGSFTSIRAALQQTGGEFSNEALGSFALKSSHADWAGLVTNSGDMHITADLVDSPGLQAEVRVTGQLQNLGTGTLRLDRGSKFTVHGGQLSNAGLLELTGSGTKLLVQNGGTLTLEASSLGGTSVQGLALLELQGAGTQLQLNHGATLDLGAQGSLHLRQGAEAQLRGLISNDGVLAVAGGAVMAVSGRLNNTGLMQVRGAGTVLDVRRSTMGEPDENLLVLFNGDHGQMEFSEHALLQVGGKVNLKGGLTVNTGASVLVDGGHFGVFGLVSGDGSLMQTSGETYVLGEVRLSQMTFTGGRVGGLGVLRGNVVFDGTAPDADLHILPGNSPGTLTIDGDVRLDGAVYELELGDRAQDQLVITGNLTLGRLNVVIQPDGAYLPDLDESFSFIRAAGISTLTGDDSQVTLDTAALGSGWVQTFRLGATGLRTTLDRLDVEELADVPAGATTHVDAGTWRYSRQLNVEGLLEVAGQVTHRVGVLDLVTGDLLEAGQLVVHNGATLSVLEGGVFSNRSELQSFGQVLNAGLLYNRAGGTIDNIGLMRNDGVLRNDGLVRHHVGTLHNTGLWDERGRLEVAAGAAFDNTGQVALQGTLVNQGLVINAGQMRVLAGGTLTGAQDATAAPDAAGTYQQIGSTAALTRVDGVLAQSRIDIVDGALEGTGRVLGDIHVGSATLRPGGSGEVGQLTLEGAVSLSGTVIELAAGPAGASRLAVQGSLDIGFGSQLYLVYQLADLWPLTGNQPDPLAPGTHLDLLSIEGSLSGAHLLSTHVLYEDPQGGRFFWSPPAGRIASFSWQGQHLVLDVTAVPEPGTWALLLGGLALVVGRSRRTAARQAH